MPRITECPFCQCELKIPKDFQGKRVKCRGCGERFEIPVPTEETNESFRLSASQILALAGAAVLLIGVFIPLVSLPIIGSLNYIQNGHGDGIIILVLAAVAAFCGVVKEHRGLWVTGLASLALLAFTYTNLQVRLADARASLERDSANGLGPAALQLVQLQWGWAVLLVGGILVVAAAIVAAVKRRPEHGRNVIILGALSIPLTLCLSGFITWSLPVAIQQAKVNMAARQAEKEAAERRAAREAAEKAAKEEAERRAAKLAAERIATNQTVVPRNNPGKRQPAQPDREWPDASLNAFQQGDVRVWLMGLRVRNKQWQIRLQIENVGAGQAQTFHPWSLAQGDDAPRLTDERGNSYRLVGPGQLGQPAGIAAGKPLEDWLAFESPQESATSLRLELPASAFEGTGQLRMRLPEDMVFFALAPMMGAKAVPRLVQTLNGDESTNQRAAAAALAELGREAVPALAALSRALRGADEEARCLAATALGNCGADGRKALPELLHGLADGSERVRQAITEALEKTGPPTPADIPIFAAATRNPSARVKLYAIRGLAAFGPKAKEAVPDLVTSLKDSDGDIRSAAVSALVTIRPEASMLPGLVAVLQHDSKDISAAAADVFARIGPVAGTAVGELRLALTSRKPHVRALAARTLGVLGPAAKPAIPDLKGALQDMEIDVRQEAAQALTRIGADAGTGTATALVAALIDPDLNVARQAREGLEKLESLSTEEVPGLVMALEKGNEDVRAFAVAALGKIGPGAKDAAPVLIKALTNDHELAVRRGAAEALGKIGPRAWTAATALGKALQDRDPELRTRAAVALGGIGPDAKAGVPGLIRAMKDKTLQEEATRALVRIGRGAIRDLIEAAENPKDYELRMKALGVLGKMGPEAKDAVEALTTLATTDKAASVRQATRETLAKIQGKPK